MEVNRVGGSFHIAPGKSFTINHVHVHDVQPYSSSVFNTTHFIRHLSFGTDIEGANTAPLDGVDGIAKEGAVMFQYYLKIVPTMSIGHFATNICAIIGGVFTVAGIIDALLYHSLNAFHNKIVLGKTG
ncbi:hypothetical protein HF086_009298 [Spodoptera exigua]|uniref:Endoplasmic reticulum-Golgi intermediate compartment protein 3 n=1 Tax=Spodoptera exigua TaxID=7107 RepID=A0A922M1P9_SPOEX|nr:hypothetical protein HF086_009298 [Spodoptera exigua]